MNRVKTYLIYTYYLYSIFIILGIVITFFRIDNNFYTKKTHDNLAKIKLELNTVSKSNCNFFISNLIDYYENTNFSGDTNILELYKKDNSKLLNLNFDHCKYSDSDLEQMNNLLLSAKLNFDLIFKLHSDNYKIVLGEHKKSKLDFESTLYEDNRQYILKAIDISMKYFRNEDFNEERQNM